MDVFIRTTDWKVFDEIVAEGSWKYEDLHSFVFMRHGRNWLLLVSPVSTEKRDEETTAYFVYAIKEAEEELNIDFFLNICVKKQ